MDIRNPIKIALRHVGHALSLSLHNRLDSVEHQLSNLEAHHNNIAATQTALLQAAIHSVETQKQLQAQLQEEIDELKRLLAGLTEAESKNGQGHS